MTIIRTTFEISGTLYNRLFSDWLHINFLIRTVLLLLMVWLMIYVFALLLRYVIMPVVLMCYYKAVKKNGAVISNAEYAGIARLSRQSALRLMIIFGVTSTLWVTAFGLHQEYAVPVMVADVSEPTGEVSVPIHEYSPVLDIDTPIAEVGEPFAYNDYGWLNPAAWPFNSEIVLYLNEVGAKETRLRSGPGIVGYSVIEMLWDNDKLVYLHSFYPDLYVRGLYWLRVLSPSGTEGYVSSQLVGVVN